MTLDDARAHVGDGVVYRPAHGAREQGVITSVNDAYVFVRYGADQGSKATRPADLQLLADVNGLHEFRHQTDSIYRHRDCECSANVVGE
jgi:hypothetical protein